MAKPPPPPASRIKTENLSLRIDPKTKFILEFVARVKGQSITTVVERSIRENASSTKIEGEHDIDGRNWTHFWDPDEGVRTVKLINDPAYPTTYEEDELREFTHKHWQFFYSNEKRTYPHRGYIEIIWPKINDYLDVWRTQKYSDYWAAGNLMKQALKEANVAQPKNWPPVAADAAKRPPDLDEEIPF